MTPSQVTSKREGASRGSHAWAVVLAGGKGTPLRGLTRHVYGEERPKQYAVLTGEKSLLRQTLDRVRLRIPTERTAVVTMAGQASYMTAELRNLSPSPYVMEQPKDKGTAATILLAAHWIVARDPEAVMVVLPSDHFVTDDSQFMDQVSKIVAAIGDRPEQIALLGAEPSGPETNYGWIELGEPLPGSEADAMCRVLRFVEKPDQATAEALFRMGALWNTLVFGGRAEALVDAGRECLPALHDRLIRIDRFRGTEHERWAVAQAYEFAPRASFSREVLERCPTKLAALRLSSVSWCDLGTPGRVIRSLGELGIRPAWLATFKEPAEDRSGDWVESLPHAPLQQFA